MYEQDSTTRTATFRSTLVESDASGRAFVFAVNQGDDLRYSVLTNLAFVGFADGVATVTIDAPGDMSNEDVNRVIVNALPYGTPLASTVSDVSVTSDTSTAPDSETIAEEPATA